MPDTSYLIPLVLALLGGATVVSVSRRLSVLSILLTVSGLLALTACSICVIVFGESVTYTLTFGLIASGLGVSLSIQSFKVAFILAFTLVGIAVSIYSYEYLKYRHLEEGRVNYWVFLNLTYMLVTVLLLADDFITYVFAFDASLIMLAFLIAYDRTYVKSRWAARIYVVASLLASALILMGFFTLYVDLSVVSFEEIKASISKGGVSPLSLWLSAVLMLAGFSIKAGVYPLHQWLPRTHPVAPTPISAFLSGFMVSTGVYGVTLIYRLLIEVPTLYYFLFMMGFLSILYGSIMALAQNDLKKLAAYSTISHMGLAYLMIASSVTQAESNPALASAVLSATSMYILGHALGKSALFMIAGNIEVEIGTRDLNKVGQLMSVLRISFINTLLVLLTLTGIPPSITFLSKAFYHTVLARHTLGEVVLDYSLATLATILTTSYLAKILYKAFIHETERSKYYELVSKFRGAVPIKLEYIPLTLTVIAISLGFAGNTLRYFLIEASIQHVGVARVTISKLVESNLLLLYASTEGLGGFTHALMILFTLTLPPLSLILGLWAWTHFVKISEILHEITSHIYHFYLLAKVKAFLYHTVKLLELVEDTHWITFLSSLILMLLVLLTLVT